MIDLEPRLNGNGAFHTQNPDRPIKIEEVIQPVKPLARVDDPVKTLLQAIWEISVAGIPPLLKKRQIQAFRRRIMAAALAVQKGKGYYTQEALDFTDDEFAITAEVSPEKLITYHRFIYDPNDHSVKSPYYPSESISLTAAEGRLIRILLVNGGHFIPYERMVVFVLGIDGGDIRSLKTHVTHIRHKIGDTEEFTGHSKPIHIINKPNTGYEFRDDPLAS